MSGCMPILGNHRALCRTILGNPHGNPYSATHMSGYLWKGGISKG